MARILAALSGGIDSSVAAALLVGEGHDVVGVSLQLSDESRGGTVSRCCSPGDLRDARRVCDHLGIPHYVINEEEAFEEEVIAPFVQAYREGRTPNPCVGCNSRLKFGTLMEVARSIGAQRIATGHYARSVTGSSGTPRLMKGRDAGKDQSYFLWDLDQAQRRAALFPLGEMTKIEVSSAAVGLGLPVAGKAESQDLCFLPAGGVDGFLAERLGPAPPSKIRHRDGRLLGISPGLHAVTVGQRRGLGLASSDPLYVLSNDPARREITVGEREHLLSRRVTVTGARLHASPPSGEPFHAVARIRSRHEGAAAVAIPGEEGELEVRFHEPQEAVTPGQALVLYDGEEVLGGGWIDSLPRGSAAPGPVDCAGISTERA